MSRALVFAWRIIMDGNMLRALIELFKLVPVEETEEVSEKCVPLTDDARGCAEEGASSSDSGSGENFERRFPKGVVPPEKCLASGFVVIGSGKPLALSKEAFLTCREIWGVDEKKLNNTFHKSFGTVASMPPEVYYLHQYMHYLSTYGAEELGIKDYFPTYVPDEPGKLPEGKFPLEKVTVLRAADETEIREELDRYALKAVSPGIKELVLFTYLLDLVTVPAEAMACYELRVRKHKHDDTVPEDPVSFLRYLVYCVTGETLLIKNKELTELIRQAPCKDNWTARSILKKTDLNKLSSIFLRYKPIFLSFKIHNGCAPFINRLRRLAEKNHRPLPYVCLQNAIRIAVSGDMPQFGNLVAKASNRELLKLYNSCAMSRGAGVTDRVFFVRNGKIFVRNFLDRPNWDYEGDEWARLSKAKEMIFSELVKRLSSLGRKTFIIPEYIDYALPWTERQFVGAYPYGTRITVPEDSAFTAGIHWNNAQNMRVDLDLHLNSVRSHFGWNGSYAEESEIIYSGDMTNAPEPEGAAEAYYISAGFEDVLVLSVNEYSGPPEVGFRFFLADNDKDELLSKAYVFSQEKALFTPVPLKFDSSELAMNLGVFNKGKFVFYGGRLSNRRIPQGSYNGFIDGVLYQLDCRLMLKELLSAVGAKILSPFYEPAPDSAPESIVDLRPEALKQGTLLALIDGQA